MYLIDMFYIKFKKDLMNEVEGRRYRYMVLVKGGFRDEMVLLEEFFGWKLSLEVFYKELGLEG